MRWFVKLLFFVPLIWQLRQNIAIGYEYCKDKDYLCKGGSADHIICDQSAVPLEGDYTHVVPMTRKLRNYILKLHNDRRNWLACGEVKDKSNNNFPKAAKMRELIWDHELAYSAEIHAKRCNMEHDKCHNTQRFRSAGQNLYSGESSEEHPGELSCVNSSVALWFNEHNDVPDGPKITKKLPPLGDISAMVGHFTAMSNDRVSRVGCGFTYCRSHLKKYKLPHTQFVSCNYDYTNMIGEEIYSAGPAASKCGDWGTSVSSEYRCLCANNGRNYQHFKPMYF